MVGDEVDAAYFPSSSSSNSRHLRATSSYSISSAALISAWVGKWGAKLWKRGFDVLVGAPSIVVLVEVSAAVV